MASVAVLFGATACGADSGPSTADEKPTASLAQREPQPAAIAPALRRLERRYDARLGVFAVDTGSGRRVAHRADERFPFASTFKVLAAAAILRKYGLDRMDRRIPIERLVNAYSPITARHVGRSMTLKALCDAAVRYSDNTAANLLHDRLGGPIGLDSILEQLGDDVTRMERREPELNDWAPGQTRDTSTPRALAQNLRTFVLDDALERPERQQLIRWLRTNTTGATLIRAGVPDDWVVGDKTGTGGTYGSRNDIAVVWPPDRAPLIIAIMTNRRTAEAEPDDRLLARTAAAVAAAFS